MIRGEHTIAREPRYELDEDTRKLLEECLSWSQRIVDLQEDDDTADDMQAVLLATCDRLGIDTVKVHYEQSEQGTVNIRVEREEPKHRKPELKVIQGDKPEEPEGPSGNA